MSRMTLSIYSEGVDRAEEREERMLQHMQQFTTSLLGLIERIVTDTGVAGNPNPNQKQNQNHYLLSSFLLLMFRRLHVHMHQWKVFKVLIPMLFINYGNTQQARIIYFVRSNWQYFLF